MTREEYAALASAHGQLGEAIDWADRTRDQIAGDMQIRTPLHGWDYTYIAEVADDYVTIYFDDTWGHTSTTDIPIEALVGEEEDRRDFIRAVLAPVSAAEKRAEANTAKSEKSERRRQYEALRAEFGDE